MRRHRTAHSLLSALLQIILLWTNVNPRSHNGLLLMLVSCVKAQQQPQFIHTTATLSQSRVELAATSLGELVFFAGGAASFTLASGQVDIYNATNGNWTTATLSIPRAGLGAVSLDNLVFFAGGTDAYHTNITYDRIDIYNISDGSWSTATLSVARGGPAAASVGDLVLFGGGYNITILPPHGAVNVTDIYNMTSNTWTTATLSQGRYFIGVTTVANRWVLFGGGQIDYAIGSNVVDIYDSMNRTWSTATLSQARGSLAAASFGNLAFFGGGNTTGTAQASNVVDIFNSTSQTWSNTTLSQARYFLAASSIGDIVAFGGGTPDGFTVSAVVDMYNVTSNIWFTATLSQPRAGLVAAPSTNKILFGGGLSNTGVSNVVDIFDFSTMSPPSSPSNSTSHTGAIVGIVIGSVFLLIGVVALILIVILIRKRTRKVKPEIQTNQISSDENIIFTEITKLQNSIERSQISFKELVVVKEIGEGSYGKVFFGKWNDAPVALKFCRNKGTLINFLGEIKVMLELPPHPNVVQMFGVSLDGPQPVIVMEYCDGGSLDKLLFDRHDEQGISNERKMELIQGIARGIFHLHKHNIVHRDLAARNILLSGNGDPKISDFGMSRILEQSEEGKTQSEVGPVRWMAPESIATRNYSKKSDVWMFGIVVYEIVAQCEPHKEFVNMLEVATAIRDNFLTPKIPDNCPPLLRQVMEMCWQKDPEQRPTMETMLAMLSASIIVGTG